jgi:hypothetical protein
MIRFFYVHVTIDVSSLIQQEEKLLEGEKLIISLSTWQQR